MPTHKLQDLLDLMTQLRDPKSGCPWDREQDFSTIAPYTIEEAYEVADAIDHNEMEDLKKELGDLLFQVVFHSQMAKEKKAFEFADVIHTITEKMITRHPHVFGEEEIGTIEEQRQRWEEIKRKEQCHQNQSALDGIAKAMPALSKAKKLQHKAASVGFDWPTVDGIFDKLDEEIEEVKEALVENDKDHITEEIGDLFFVVVNLARFLHIDPEAALRKANIKFEQRFRGMERNFKQQGKDFSKMDIDAMEQAWQEQKKKSS